MNILDKIPAPLITAARYAVTFSTGVIAATAGAHVISQSDAQSLTAAVNNIAAGVTSIAGGVATLVGFATALYAGMSSTRAARITAVASDPNVRQIVTTPEIATAAPSNKVVSQ